MTACIDAGVSRAMGYELLLSSVRRIWSVREMRHTGMAIRFRPSCGSALAVGRASCCYHGVVCAGSTEVADGLGRRRCARLLARVLAALGLLMIIVTFTPLTAWWLRALSGSPGRPDGEVLIVLGGDRYDTRTLGVSSYWRCVYAAEAYREGRFRRIVVSGGGVNEVPIATTVRDCLLHYGVSQEAIWLETASNSTRENALYVKRLLEHNPGRCVLLTSDIHTFRARRAFERVGQQVIPWPVGQVGRLTRHKSSRWSAFIALCQETAKIFYYFTRGWL